MKGQVAAERQAQESAKQRECQASFWCRNGKKVKNAGAASMNYLAKHADVVGVIAGVGIGLACTALTGGAGALFCGALGGVVSGLVIGGLKCYGGDKSRCGGERDDEQQLQPSDPPGQHSCASIGRFRGRGVLVEETGTAKGSPDMPARESLAWQRYGPVWYRIRKLGMVGFILGGAYLWLLVAATLISLYQGAGMVGAKGPPERAVQGTVQDCQRVGPLSDHGLGYWWICDITVQAAGRADTHGVVTRSIATPDQVGQTIELRQRCFSEQNTDCSYGKPTNRLWGLYLGGMRIVGYGVVLLLGVFAVFHAVVGIAGAPRYVRFIERREQRQKKAGS